MEGLASRENVELVKAYRNYQKNSPRDKQTPPESDWFVWLIRAGRGFGKMMPLDTPIPTPTGWTTMGEISVGDVVYDEKGNPCNVINTTPVQIPKKAYKFNFDDGSSIVSCSKHQWVTWTHYERKAYLRSNYVEDKNKFPDDWPSWNSKYKHPAWDEPKTHKDSKGPQVRTTGKIVQTQKYGKRNDNNHSIPLNKAIKGKEYKLPIEPYVLGAWLGDGHNHGAIITIENEEIIKNIENLGVKIRKKKTEPGKAKEFKIGFKKPKRDEKTGRMKSNGSYTSKLKKMGVANNKHIPEKYLRSTIEKRRELLAGLLDTDGTASKKATSVSFTSTNKQLAKDFSELCISLGYKTNKDQRPCGYNGKITGTAYRVRFKPDRKVFGISQKNERIKLNKSQQLRHRHRMIVGIEKTDTEPMRCITVDSGNSMYLAGKQMVPTHNTFAGARWLHSKAQNDPGCWMALIGKTPGDVRDDCIDGPGGILAQQPPEVVENGGVEYEPSKRRIEWPNGSYATIYSGANHDQIRGFSGSYAWCDEFAAWDYPEQAWDNLMFGMREGEDPCICITTTPKPIDIIQEIEDEDSTVTVTGSTYENEDNLNDQFLKTIESRYEGTTKGQQEIHAEYIDQSGTLWSYDIIHHGEKPNPQDLQRIVISVDPAVTSNKDSDETGIVACAEHNDGDYYVLEDASLKGSPSRWADVAVALYHEHKADKVVAEVNQGGDMVENVIRQTDQNVNYGEVRATRGKTIRAEPVVALYEKGRVVHAENFNELEAQMIRFSGEKTSDSPDRMDALVWAITELSESKKTSLTWGS